ncbi:Poly [ADP-ribose] polymerase tankyrase [Phytophthora ramorum]|uniref:Poly [ADP-ribose] polymerase tankyrase n=1 Tax=Phytophthora ramorum TaxID=164328 RepID=UPI00309E20D9|nr:Poly [ADP-ribose] polymerase tankyrase [Phytophthora ramorum]
MAGKRKWQEEDWDVVLAAQTFVAVLAEEEAPVKKRGKKKNKKTATRRSPRATKEEKEEKKEEDVDMDVVKGDEFWLAQLQDDVTEDMLAQEDVSVHVTWLNRTAASRYTLAYDEQVDVGSILCHVFLRELSASALELTPKSLARVQRSLSRTKRRLAGEDVGEDEEEDSERPPPTSSRKRRAADEDKVPSPAARGKTQKLSKREAAMHIPPLRVTVDEATYEDRELFGQQPFGECSGDVASANREVVRAVLTKNVKMLKKITTDSYAGLSTFDAPRSADVAHTALHYAIDSDDLAAAALLRQTVEKVDKQQMAATPEVALPSHSTGQHTSRFSDYNRRAINASRGGKEGNNALLGDVYPVFEPSLSLDYLWRSPNASVEMLTLLYPTGDWTSGYSVGINVCHAARCGNFRLVRKVVETLEKNGGWGFNELHHKVLADGPTDDGEETAPLLPPFRAVSAIKQAHQTRLRPLHLAAINPNTKYLEALWDVAGDEFGAIKDDQGYEPIHYAAGCESPAPMLFLLEKRCGMFGRTKTRMTPLMCALEAGREETTLALLKFAATPGENGGGGQEVADKLVREKGPGGKQAVHFAARHGCAKVLEYLLTECGEAAAVNAASGGASKATPLTLAAQNGHLECVRVLLANGARVDLGDKLKKTPLILAVKNGHTRVAAVLINGGANVNAYDTSENSVAHYAASYGWPSCLQLLCDVGAELWSQNAWGFVPLACALLKQRRACAELILAQVSGEAQQKFLDFRDRQGRTMLFLQCQHSHSLGQISYLCGKGLNPNISDSDGEYPLQRLIKRACDEAPRTEDGSVSNGTQDLAKFFLEAVGLLLQHGAHPQYELYREELIQENTSEPVKLQPLQLAMVGNQTEIVDLLLKQNGVRPDAQSSDGSDAWMTAAALGAGLGDSYLSKLLVHNDKSANGGPLKLAGRTRPQHENFFHVVANHNASQLAAIPKLIRQCVDKCPTTAEMMCEKDKDGYTPVMRLLDPRHERSVSSTTNQTDPDKLQRMRDIDTRLTELLGLYAENTTHREAYVRCEEAARLRGRTGATSPTEDDGEGSNDVDAAAVTGVDNFGSSKSDSEYSDPDDSGDDGDDDSSNDSDDDGAITSTPKPLPVPDASTKYKSKPMIMVEYETALHLIAKRKLTSEPTNPWMQWYGCAEHSAKCLMHLLLEKRPEIFSSSPDGQDKSLVNFVHLGSFKTALQYAVESGDVPTVRVLLTHHADANLSPVRCTNCKAFAIDDAIARSSGGATIRRDSLPACTGNCGVDTLLEPALYEAVKSKRIKCTRLLLKYGAQIDCVSKTTRRTPLHVALEGNDGASVSALLSHGASLMAKDTFGASPLHLAVVSRHSIPSKEAHAGEVAYSTVTIAQSLPAGRSNSTNTSLFSVSISSESSNHHEQSPDVVEPAILVALKDPSAPKAVIVGDKKNRSPVHFAAQNRDLELLRELIFAAGKSGARDAVNQRDWLGRTPLHYAVNAAAMTADASFAVERFLLQNGADASIQDDFGFGALHFALIKVRLDWHEKYDVTHKKTRGQKDREGQVLDKQNYDIERREAFLRHLAVIPGTETDPVETVSNLAAERGLDFMARDELGRSSLHLAAATGAFVCVSTLLASSGDTTKQKAIMALEDRDGFTPLGLAVFYKRQTTIMTLLRSGSAVDGKLRITQSSSNSREESVRRFQNGVTTKTKPEPKVKTRSYFYHAVNNGLTGICHMLLNATFCRRQAIEDSVRCGQFQLANNLLGVLESGAGGGLELLKRTNSHGETLLHSLAKTRQTGFDNLAKKLAWALVDAGVRADIQDKKGNLALHYAAKRGNTRLSDFLHHQDGGAQTENVKNKAGESPLLFALKQKRTGSNLGDDQLLTVLCYFVEHPSHSLDILQGDDSKMNVLGAFLDRFVESLAVSKPVLFFSMLETLLKRGVDSNASFHSTQAATLERRRHPGENQDNDQLLRSGRELYEITSLAKGDNDKMPPLVRVAITTDASVRYHALALLLRYGAKLSIPDGRGNTLLMHLAARNLTAEMRLALGLIRSVPDPKDVFSLADSTRVCSLHVPEASVKAALAQQNAAGLTACHMAVQPLDYGSYENARLLAMLVRAGGDLRTRDASGKSVIDYARDQRSQFVLRFLERTFPDFVTIQPDTSKPKTIFASAPTYLDDANAYLAECEASGKISRSRVVAKVNASCDVGKVSKVLCEGDGEGTELDALLTKVDVKNGRFGLNVFYRLQLVRDELQDILVLFTNWGRIGETGKFQNTPFRDEAEAVNEFKKIFRSKTGNTWETRAPGEFVKKPKKYNLVQRVNYATKVDDEVTRSFREDMDNSTSKGVVFPEPSDADLVGSPNVMAMLAAITDVRNLQLAAQTSCGFAGGDLPLAKQDELRTALEKLQEIRDLLKEKEELVKEIGTASGDLSDDGATKRALLATRHEALTEKVSERSSRYYEIMPCQEDSDVLASSIKAFDQVGDVNVEITRLRMLSDIMETYKMLLGAKRAQPTQNPLEYCYHALQVRLAPLQPADAERQLIHRYFFGGLRSHDRQRYRISNVFEVERRGETQRFNELMEERPDLRATQTHLLWHGTKRTNLMGILSQGLRVAPPEAPHHGYAYGKGLYFANVAEKSLNYCDAPYALPILDKDGKPDKSTTKTREVHYMLLCEVALGKPTELTATAAWGGDPLPREGMDSVKALAVHNPDPRGALVSPKCGAKLHLGQVMQLGIKLPYDLVWAKTEPNPSPIGWYERNPKFAAETQEYLAKLLADKTFAVGDTHTVSTSDNRALFVQYQFDERTIIIELLSRETPGASLDEDDADAAEVAPQKVGSGAWCEATLKVTIRPDNDAAYSYSVKLYRNTLTSSPLADGFTLVEPVLSDYAELVVYKEAQARIRYVVEVETV